MTNNRYLFTVIILLIVSVKTSISQNIEWEKVHDLTIKGIAELYSLKINNAVNHFNEVISTAPNDPRGYFFKAMSHYYRYFLLNESEDYDKFMKASDDVIKVCKNYLKHHEDAKFYFYLGGIKGYRGIIRTLYTSGPPSLSVLKEGKEAFESLDRAIKLNPELYDAYMGFGLFTYLIGSLPKAFRWIASIIGFEGDKKKGLEYLRLANEKGLYTKYEALWWLTFFYMGENDDENASKSIEAVLKKFPTNTFYLFLMANFEMGLNKIDRALDYYSRATIIRAPEMKKLSYYAYAGLGRCYYLKNNFDEAIKKYETFLSSISEKDDRWRNRDNSAYNLAVAYEIIGNREKAVSFYNQVKYNEFASLRLKHPLTSNQIEIIKAYNHGIANNYEQGIEKINQLIASQNFSSEEEAYSYYMLGSLHRAYKNYESSNESFSEVLNHKIQKENWLKPYAHFYLGQNYVNLNDYAQAKKQFDKVEDFEDYYGEKSLKRSLQRAIDKLDEKESK